MNSLILALVLFFALASHEVAATVQLIHMSPFGNDNNDGGPENPVATLKRAVDLVADNGTIVVDMGVYSDAGNTNFIIKKSLTVKAQYSQNTPHLYRFACVDSSSYGVSLQGDNGYYEFHGVSFVNCKKGIEAKKGDLNLHSVLLESTTYCLEVNGVVGVQGNNVTFRAAEGSISAMGLRVQCPNARASTPIHLVNSRFEGVNYGLHCGVCDANKGEQFDYRLQNTAFVMRPGSDGGALHVGEGKTTVECSGCTVNGKAVTTQKQHGDKVVFKNSVLAGYMVDKELAVDIRVNVELTLIDVVVRDYADGVYIGTQGSKFNAQRTKFANIGQNSTATNANAVHLKTGVGANFKDCEFTNNLGTDGAGLFVGEKATVNIINTKFVSNHATEKGGGLSCAKTGFVTMIGGSFASNVANDGASAWCDATCRFVANGVTRTNNGPGATNCMFG